MSNSTSKQFFRRYIAKSIKLPFGRKRFLSNTFANVEMLQDYLDAHSAEECHELILHAENKLYHLRTCALALKIGMIILVGLSVLFLAAFYYLGNEGAFYFWSFCGCIAWLIPTMMIFLDQGWTEGACKALIQHVHTRHPLRSKPLYQDGTF